MCILCEYTVLSCISQRLDIADLLRRHCLRERGHRNNGKSNVEDWSILASQLSSRVSTCTQAASRRQFSEKATTSHQIYRSLKKTLIRVGNCHGSDMPACQVCRSFDAFLQDDMILNYWNLLQADKEKLWITNKVCRLYPAPLVDIFLFLIMYVLSINALYKLAFVLDKSY